MRFDYPQNKPPGCEPLVSALSEKLLDARSSHHVGTAWVCGALSIPTFPQRPGAAVPVPITVEVTESWTRHIPKVTLAERPMWLKTGADWHVFANGWVCFELPERWCDHILNLLDLGVGDIPELASQWITRATAHILHVHYVCHHTGRKAWPPSIPAWKHGDEGRLEYKREKESARKIHPTKGAP
jgi:hypothetical protein